MDRWCLHVLKNIFLFLSLFCLTFVVPCKTSFFSILPDRIEKKGLESANDRNSKHKMNKQQKKSLTLIHSANPKSWPVGIIVFAHVVRTSSVRPSPLFKSRKTEQQKTMFATGVTMGLAEWIIDDTCLVVFVSVIMRYVSQVPLVYLRIFPTLSPMIRIYCVTYQNLLWLNSIRMVLGFQSRLLFLEMMLSPP